MANFTAPIVEAMRRYSADAVTPFHTPGHKHGRGAHEILRGLLTAQGLRQEVSLMDELDDLHAEGFCNGKFYGTDCGGNAAVFGGRGNTVPHAGT